MNFCSNTACSMRKAKKTLPSQRKVSKHKTTKIEGHLALESLLQTNPHCFVLFLIQHNNIWWMYKKADATFWTPEEIDLSANAADWNRLSPTEQHFISHILAFFAASDGIIDKNLSSNFAIEVTLPEAQCFYGFQIAVKNIHSETYSLLINTYVKDPTKKTHLLQAIETVPCVQQKIQWALWWCDSTTASFAKHMIAFTAVKGIFFSGSFCAIFWLKKRGLMLGLCLSNELISRDKGLHCNFACLMYSKLVSWLPELRIFEIVSSVVAIELIGMNSAMMCNYIEFCTNRLLITLGYQHHYKVRNPLKWMETTSLQRKTNFFEKRVGKYSKSGAGVDRTDQSFAPDASF